MQEVIVKILKEDGVSLPLQKTALSAGFDISAKLSEPFVLKSGEFALIPTGIKMAIQSGYEAQIRPRSGLAAKYGVTVLNSPGTIDADYRGEVKIILINHGKQDFVINDKERIAQVVIAPVVNAKFEEVSSLLDTERGEGGFGSTGV
ncbi:MAG: dUTP diphosphatase [Sphaerochaetaceae bacterium]|nr:dUTP diphosphatase [Sphaerochaetaceae bacterium]